MSDPWKWHTRISDNSPVFAMLFDGQNHAAIARVPDIKIETDMFAEVRFRMNDGEMPQFASTGDYIVWENGTACVWNRASFTRAHREGKPTGRKLGPKDSGLPPQ